MSFINPKHWAGWRPTGLGLIKPHHFRDMLRVLWENRDQLPYAWRILTRGTCDGCALGTTGLKDWTLKGVHLCAVRLQLLRLNTAPALDTGCLADVGPLMNWNNRRLRALGRLPHPLRRRRSERGFTRISWDEALGEVAAQVRASAPERTAYYITSRGLTNENYYAAQKAVRSLGTNNIDYAARICHSPSTVALKQSLGVSASTCSYSDWIGSDLVVLFGSDMPNNQPVSVKYLYEAKLKGTRVVVVNPYREPGLERYWIPSVAESAIFGTRIADEFYEVHTGGDRAFITGVLKILLAEGGLDEAFIRDHTAGFAELKAEIEAAIFAELEHHSGTTRAEMARFARTYRAARTAVFIWSMGLTQHAAGVDNVQALINLALARGMVGREKCGLVPIRGHSGVQGGAEVGCVPDIFPGRRPVNAAGAREMEALWGFKVPETPGLLALQMMEAAAADQLDMLWCTGGNFMETLPDPQHVRATLERIPLRVHHDVVVSPSMLVDTQGTVLLLPASTRYEQPGGGTETTTERRIVFSPEIPGRRVGEARAEWQVFGELAARVRPEQARLVRFETAAAIRAEIGRVVPYYAGIEKLSRQGDMVQWGGQRLCDGWDFPLPGGRARFFPALVAHAEPPQGQFRLSTRRGKQFNSMLWNDRDPLNGAAREDVLMNEADAREHGLAQGDPVLLTSPTGQIRGFVRLARIRPRNVQVHWPEGNALIPRGRVDLRCGVPDYNVFVSIEKARP